MTLAGKVLLKILGSLSLGIQGQRPIFKPSQQCPQCVPCDPLSESHSSPRCSLSFALKRTRGNGIHHRRGVGGIAGSNDDSGFSGRRNDGLQGTGIQQRAFWLKSSADSAPQGKSLQWEHRLFYTLLLTTSPLRPYYVLARAFLDWVESSGQTAEYILPPSLSR